MMVKRFLPLTLLTLLAACDLFTPDPVPAPADVAVSTVTPQPGATAIPVETSVEATLELQGRELNILTLTESSVQLVGPEGPVAANRSVAGETIIVQPSAPLAGETTYTFTVTDELQTTDNTAVTPFQSTFATETTSDPSDPGEPTDPTEPTPPPVDPTDPGDGVDGLVMANAAATPSPSRMVLSRIGEVSDPCQNNDDPECNNDRWNELKTTDTGEVVLRNTGGSSLSLTLSTSAPDVYTVTPTAITLEPGESASAEIAFIGDYASKGVYKAYVDAEAGGQRASVEIAGVYMTRPEGGSEPSLRQILQAVGLQADLGDFRTNVAGSAPAGSEVRSQFWQKADPGSDVVVTALAAFKTCCFNYQVGLTDFELFEPDATDGSDYFFQLQYDQDYAQTMYPAGTDGDVPNEGTTDFTGPFRIQVDRYSTKDLDQSGLVGVRVWPVTGQANTYIVGQDYALAECGTAAEDSPDGLTANCDYQDHVYLVENIEPYTAPE